MYTVDLIWSLDTCDFSLPSFLSHINVCVCVYVELYYNGYCISFLFAPVLGSNIDRTSAIPEDNVTPIVLAIPGLTSDSESPVSFLFIYFFSWIWKCFLGNSGVSSNILLDFKAYSCLVYTVPYAFDLVFWFINLFFLNCMLRVHSNRRVLWSIKVVSLRK